MKSLQIYSNNFLKYATAPDGVTWPEGVEKLFNNNRLDPFTYPGTSLTLDFLVKDASGLAASRSADCIIIKNSNIAAVNLQWYTLDGVIKPGAAFTVNGQDIMYFLPETLTSGRFVLNITAMPGSAALSIGTLQCFLSWNRVPKRRRILPPPAGQTAIVRMAGRWCIFRRTAKRIFPFQLKIAPSKITI